MPHTDDEKIWAAYAKNIKPLGKNKKPVSARPAPKKQPLPPADRKQLPAKQKPPAAVSKPLVVSFDRRTEQRLRQGAIEIEAKLDLHGMRQDEAHDALHAFIDRQVKTGRRYLLIITGKGPQGQGVLRSNLAPWLMASPHALRILAIRPAAVRHGGAGAFYVLLKRQRNGND